MGGRGGSAPATTAPTALGVVSVPLAQQLRSAYAGLASEQGAYVSLERLRGRFPGVPRQDLDNAIKSLVRESDDVSLVPENNQKSLTQGQRDAALRFGGQDKHLISIFRVG